MCQSLIDQDWLSSAHRRGSDEAVHFKPRPYQQALIDHLHAGAESLVFVEMGLGKTAAVLQYIWDIVNEDWNAREQRRRFLVVAPLRVCREVWRQESKKWSFDLSIGFASGTPKQRRAILDAEYHDVVCINYENLSWLCDQYEPGTLPFYGLVLDEVDKMKDAGSKRFAKFRYRAHEFEVRIGMTGTPASEAFLNLWGPAFLVTSRPLIEGKLAKKMGMQSMLGSSFTVFETQYFMPIHPYSRVMIPRDKATEAMILERIKPYVFEARTRDHLDLPSLIVNDLRFDLPPEARKFYDDMERHLLVLFEEGEITAANAAVKSGKLRQICSGFLYEGEKPNRKTHRVHDEKVRLLRSVQSEMMGEQHIAVHEFQVEVEMHEFKHRLSSEVPERVEAETLRAWTAGEIRQLAFHPASGGHGLNLHEGGAHHIVFVSLPWSCGLYDQTIARLHRMGQEQSVVVHRFLAKNTIEEDIAEALAAKKDVQEAVFEGLRRRHA